MSRQEERDAQRLADWLDGSREAILQTDAAPAIYAIRPDLAPEPQVSLDDILDRVTSGPFSESDAQVEDAEVGDSDVAFVKALFETNQAAPAPKTTIDEVLNRVQSGPFIAEDSSNDVVDLISDPPIPANNNRWWRNPVWGLGAVAALTLIVLLPTNFEAPQQQESMFAPKTAMEEAPPADEIEAEDYPATEVARNPEPAKRPPQAAPKRSQEGLADGAGPEDSDVTVQKSPQAAQPSSVAKDASTKALEASKAEIATNVMPEEAERSAPTMMEPAAAEKTVETRFDEDMEEAEPVPEAYMAEPESVEEVLSKVALDDVAIADEVAETVVESSTRGAVLSKEQSSGLFGNTARRERAKSKRTAAPGASMDTMPSAAEQTNDVANDSSVELPTQLTASEIQSLRTASIETVRDMCDVNNPTRSLDILWYASQNRSSSNALSLLTESAKYDQGDTRYLKRNWQRLSQLYQQQGNMERANYYQQLANGLP